MNDHFELSEGVLEHYHLLLDHTRSTIRAAFGLAFTRRSVSPLGCMIYHFVRIGSIHAGAEKQEEHSETSESTLVATMHRHHEGS